MRATFCLFLSAALLSAAPAFASCITLPNMTKCTDSAGGTVTTNHVGTGYGGMTQTTATAPDGTGVSSTTQTTGAAPATVYTGNNNVTGVGLTGGIGTGTIAPVGVVPTPVGVAPVGNATVVTNPGTLSTGIGAGVAAAASTIGNTVGGTTTTTSCDSQGNCASQ